MGTIQFQTFPPNTINSKSIKGIINWVGLFCFLCLSVHGWGILHSNHALRRLCGEYECRIFHLHSPSSHSVSGALRGGRMFKHRRLEMRWSQKACVKMLCICCFCQALFLLFLAPTQIGGNGGDDFRYERNVLTTERGNARQREEVSVRDNPPSVYQSGLIRSPTHLWHQPTSHTADRWRSTSRSSLIIFTQAIKSHTAPSST